MDLTMINTFYSPQAVSRRLREMQSMLVAWVLRHDGSSYLADSTDEILSM